MSFLFRKPAVQDVSATVVAVPAPPKESLVPQIDACVMRKRGEMYDAETCGLLLSALMTTARIQQMSSDEYAHLIIALYHATQQGKGRILRIDSILLNVVKHAAHYLLDDALHTHISAWCAGAPKFVYMLLLLALANNRSNASNSANLCSVLCARVIAYGTIERVQHWGYIDAGSKIPSWDALFKMASIRNALMLMACIDNATPPGLVYSLHSKDEMLCYLYSRLRLGPVSETIDALIDCRHLWTTTADAPLSLIGTQIWEWLHKHPEWTRALKTVDANCFAPLNGWLLVRDTQHPQKQLPWLVGHTPTLFATLRTHVSKWIREQPALLLNVLDAVHVWNLQVMDTVHLLAQAWTLMGTARQTRFANFVTGTALAPRDALHIALRLGALLSVQAPEKAGEPLSTIFAYALPLIPADIYRFLDELEVEEGEACIHRTLVLVCRTPAYQAHFGELSIANLAVRCTGEQLLHFHWDAVAFPMRSRIYVYMVKIALEPAPLSFTDGSEYAVFSSRMTRAWRLQPVLARLVLDKGWGDFVLDRDAAILVPLTTRKHAIEQACTVHFLKDLARVCASYI
jgi:hypothetical protein